MSTKRVLEYDDRALEDEDDDGVEDEPEVGGSGGFRPPLPREENSVSFVGMNFCGARPDEPCVMTAWRTAEEAYEHGLAQHCGKREDGLYHCGWWGCDFGTQHRMYVEKHFQRHMLGHWRCNGCSELFSEKRHAVGCVHLNRLVQPTAQYSFCEFEGCEKTGVQMAPVQLRDHVTAHAEQDKEKPSFECKWRGCSKRFGSHPNYLRHLISVHLKLLWKCLSCDKSHKSQKDALACCNQQLVPEPQLWTLGCKCQWNDCTEAFKVGDGEELRAHLKKHIEADCEAKIECRWSHKQCVAAKAAIDTKVKLVRHLESVHGRLRLRCETCGKTRALNKKKEIINCDHEVAVKKKPRIKTPAKSK